MKRHVLDPPRLHSDNRLPSIDLAARDAVLPRQHAATFCVGVRSRIVDDDSPREIVPGVDDEDAAVRTVMGNDAAADKILIMQELGGPGNFKMQPELREAVPADDCEQRLAEHGIIQRHTR